MSYNYLVSIVVPVYKVETQITRCAESLFSQTFNSIEFIFVDDCSPDKSIDVLQKILEKYPARAAAVKILHHDKNEGLWKARTTGLQAATGKYLWNVDSDDYVAQNAVEKLYNTAEKESADIVCLNYANVLSNQKIQEVKLSPLPKRELLKAILNSSRICYLVLCFVKRSIYVNNGILPIPQVNYGEDYATTPRLLYFASKIAFVPDILYFYVHDNANSYCTTWKISYLEQRAIIFQTLAMFFSKHAPEYKKELTKAKINCKCQLYRMWATDKSSQNSDLTAINQWSPELSLTYLIKQAKPPYIPILILGKLEQPFFLKCYAMICKYLYHLLR